MNDISNRRSRNARAWFLILLAVLVAAMLTGCSFKKEDDKEHEDPNKKPTFEIGGIKVDLFQDFESVFEKMWKNGGAIYNPLYANFFIDSNGKRIVLRPGEDDLNDYKDELGRVLVVTGRDWCLSYYYQSFLYILFF